MKIIKKSRFSLVIITILSLCILSISSVDARAQLVPCGGSYNAYVSRTTNLRETLRRTGVFLSPGDSMSVKYGISDTRSNSATIDLVPELLSLGYSHSVSVSASVTVTVRNPTNSIKEAIAYRIYDNIRYEKGTYQGNGSCSVSTLTKKVYTGYLLTCQ